MSTHDEEGLALDEPGDPFEPEAPAHVDPDAETAAHHSDADEESVVDGADPTPPQPS